MISYVEFTVILILKPKVQEKKPICQNEFESKSTVYLAQCLPYSGKLQCCLGSDAACNVKSYSYLKIKRVKLQMSENGVIQSCICFPLSPEEDG